MDPDADVEAAGESASFPGEFIEGSEDCARPKVACSCRRHSSSRPKRVPGQLPDCRPIGGGAW